MPASPMISITLVVKRQQHDQLSMSILQFYQPKYHAGALENVVQDYLSGIIMIISCFTHLYKQMY